MNVYKSLQDIKLANSAELINTTIKNREAQIQYLLDKLQEEAAEVIQAVSKIRRFGPHNHHPQRTTTNLQELENELEDLMAIVDRLEQLKYVDIHYNLVLEKAQLLC